LIINSCEKMQPGAQEQPRLRLLIRWDEAKELTFSKKESGMVSTRRREATRGVVVGERRNKSRAASFIVVQIATFVGRERKRTTHLESVVRGFVNTVLTTLGGGGARKTP